MAIDDLLDEHEQSEKVRTWLQANGAGLIGGVILGLALIAGWQWWQKRQESARIQTAEAYQTATDAIRAKKLDQARALVGALPDGAYATLASLNLAKLQLDAGQRDAAIATLRAAHSSYPPLALIVTQRLARMLVDADKPADALQVLPAQSTDAGTLQALGDAHLALGHRDDARLAYAAALAHMDIRAPQRRLVELKLSEVGGIPAQPKAKT